MIPHIFFIDDLRDLSLREGGPPYREMSLPTPDDEATLVRTKFASSSALVRVPNRYLRPLRRNDGHEPRVSQQIIFLFAFLLSSLSYAKLMHFDARDAVQRDVVQFSSDALLEKVAGISSSVAGFVEVNPDQITEGFKGEFEVDLRTFDTGSPLRNENLRDKFFNVSEFPTATFSFTRLVNASKPKLQDQQTVIARVEGSLKLKGVSKPQTITVKLVYFKASDLTRQRYQGNLLRMSTNFDVDTSQYNITIADSLKSRLARFVQVSADLVASDAPPPILVPVAEGPKAKN
jgi:polyisoprenoid-binding protein YceI